jgi:signal transduction histidine kinase
MDERLDSRRRWWDVALSVAILLVALPPTLRHDVGGDAWTDTALLPVVLVPLPLRRCSPLLASAAFPVACVISAIPTFDQIRIPAVVAVAMVLAFTLGREAGRRDVVWGLAAIFAGLVIDGATEHVVGTFAVLAFGGPLSLAAVGGGRLVRSRDRLAAELGATTQTLEERREATASLAIEIERARLASDLDVAARQRVREIAELAELGEHARPDAAREAFGAIERLGRDALNEMRGLLGVLRSDERARRTPGPTLAELDALLADVRRGGRPVELEVDGDRVELTSDVELAAYRTLQHALAALRGGDGGPLTIVLRYRSDHLDVEVRGAPVGGVGASAALAAARERVHAHGGSFETAPTGRERQLIRARLPLAAARA